MFSIECFLLYLLSDDLRLEEPREVDDRGQDDHGHHVLEEAPPAGLGAVDGLAVVDRVVHGDVPERK